MTPARDTTPTNELSGANGVTETKLKEMIIHIALLCGWPRAMSVIMVAKEAFAG